MLLVDQNGATCAHAEEVLVFRATGRGAGRRYYWQCRCGRLSPPVLARLLTVGQKGRAVPVDETLVKAFQATRERLGRAVREETENAWMEAHSAYLKTPAWRARRAKVLKRDGGLCQACLIAPAEEVHHLTYERWRKEPCFDLTSVCRVCHETLTLLGRKRRG